MSNQIDFIRRNISGRKRNILGHERAFKSAVMLPLIRRDGEWHVLFEVRAFHLNRQPGEICFPGGRVDHHDRDEGEAAVRETCEELGISTNDIEVIGPLDILTGGQDFIIYPFVGILKDGTHVMPNQEEVDEVFYVPVSWFASTEPELHYIDLEVKPPHDFPYHLIPNGRNYNWRHRKIPEYFYLYNGRVIWGMTARILHHFVTLIK